MSTTINSRYRSGLTVTENYDTTGTGTGRNEAPFEDTTTYDSSTTPAVTGGGFCNWTLSGGALTVDLTSLTTISGRSFSLSGLKVRGLRIKNPSTNANAITVAKGASNGYTGFGASFSVTLQPGQSWLFDDGNAGTAVSGSVKTLDLSGTGSQALQVAITGGA